MGLKKLNYDRKELERRREHSQQEMRGKCSENTTGFTHQSKTRQMNKR